MSNPKRIISSSTHYWCEFCLKFIKNTAIDRKNHELGVPHQTTKAKKINELRSASADTKLTAQIAALEAAALKATSTAPSHSNGTYSSFSTYTPTVPTSDTPILPVIHPSKPETKPTPKKDDSDAALEVKGEEPKSKEASLPGQWEVVEEESQENPYFKAQNAAEFEASKPNPKKRERYEDDENALEQMESESRIMSSSSKSERVPERYRASSIAPEPSEEPEFKKKVAKGANIKKRAKQL